MTSTGAAPGRSSSATKPRPRIGFTRNKSKVFAETCHPRRRSAGKSGSLRFIADRTLPAIAANTVAERCQS
jgi:hypothetical protein